MIPEEAQKRMDEYYFGGIRMMSVSTVKRMTSVIADQMRNRGFVTDSDLRKEGFLSNEINGCFQEAMCRVVWIIADETARAAAEEAAKDELRNLAMSNAFPRKAER